MSDCSGSLDYVHCLTIETSGSFVNVNITRAFVRRFARSEHRMRILPDDPFDPRLSVSSLSIDASQSDDDSDRVRDSDTPIVSRSSQTGIVIGNYRAHARSILARTYNCLLEETI